MIKPRLRPDGSHRTSGRTTVGLAFPDFAKILSSFEPRPDGGALSSRQSHYRCK
jgi:hypothetical protein